MEKACKKAIKTEEIDVVFSLAFTLSRFYVPTSLFACFFPILPAIGPDVTAFDPWGIRWGRGKYISRSSPCEYAEKNKGEKFSLELFRSPLPVNAKDAKVSPLHLTFDLKGFLVGDYFKLITFYFNCLT